MRQYFFLWCMVLLGWTATCKAQTPKIDSLRNLLYQTTDAAYRLQVLFDLCEERSSLNSDTLQAYATAAYKLATIKKDDAAIANADFNLCNVLLKKSLFDSAIACSDERLQWLKTRKLPQELTNNFYYIKALALVRSNHFKEAITQYYQLLSSAEQIGDTLMQVKAKTGIGWVNLEINQNNEALAWLKKAEFTTTNEKLFDKYGVVYANIAAVYDNLEMPDSALFYVNKSLEIARRGQDLTNLANSLYIKAVIFINTENNAAAESALNEALQVRKRIGDPFYIVSDMAQIASFYASTNQFAKGIAMAQQGITLAQQYRLAAKLPMLYGSLAKNLKAQGDYKGYSNILEQLLLLKDSLYEKNSAEALARLQTRYDLQRQENIIIQKNLDIVRKDYWLYGTIIFFAFVLALIFVLYQNRQKQQKLLMDKLLKEQQQKETIAVLQAEEAERKRIAADLHDNLGAYAAAISSDVQFLKSSAIGYKDPLASRIETNVSDMVSQLNNTIWVLKKSSQRLTEISDRFKVWMQKLMLSYPAVDYDFDEQIETDIELPPAATLHLFHILQEAVNNAVRHSGGSKITLSFVSANDKWEICIADNGKAGLPQTFINKNGIENMKQRAAASGWQISWQVNGDQGTLVCIQSS